MPLETERWLSPIAVLSATAPGPFGKIQVQGNALGSSRRASVNTFSAMDLQQQLLSANADRDGDGDGDPRALEATTYTAWKHWADEDFGVFSPREANFFAWHLNRCHPGPVHDVLELGFGNGKFLGFAASRGLNAVGIETDPALLDRARAAGYVAHTAIADLPDAQLFDAIVAFDVLEHIPQDALIPLFRSFASKLRADGAVLCRVPNGESPFGRLYQHGDLTHCSTLGISKFRQIGVACDLKVAAYGQEPWYVESRHSKRMVRRSAQWLLGLCIAVAYPFDRRAMGPNLIVAMKKRSTQASV